MSEVKVIQNPLRELRKLSGLTQAFVAERLNLSAQYVMRQEQGMYAEMDSKLYWFYCNRLMFEKTEMPKWAMTYAAAYLRYEQFKTQQRRNGARNLYGFTQLTAAYIPNMHPLVVLRNESGMSRVGFAKAFCVSQSLVERWESRSHMVREVPPVIEAALRQGGIEETKLTVLRQAYARHLKWLSDNVSSRKTELYPVTGLYPVISNA